MPTKLGNKRNAKTGSTYTLREIFTDTIDPALIAAVFNVLQSGAMISFGMNRAQNGIKVTLFEGKDKHGEWANDPQEFLALLADIAEAYLPANKGQTS